MSPLEDAAAATFALSARGRILQENDPDRSPGPRLFLAGSPAGNRVWLRHDVSDAIIRRAEALVAAEPPWSDPDLRPACLPALEHLLGAAFTGSAVIHHLPPGLAPDAAVEIVTGDSPAGAALLNRLTTEGVPAHLTEAGFLTVADFWPPWCVAMVEGRIASMAFAARTGPTGSSIGVYTFPGFRGRGLAAAVTAAWSRLPSLAGRTLIYSALAANASSRCVIDRLDLPRIGVSLRLG